MPAADRIACQQANDSDTPLNREIVSRRSDPRDGGFGDRPTRRHSIVSLVSLTEPTRDAFWRVPKRIHQQRTCVQECRDDIGSVGVHDLPIARLEEVQQAELIYSPPFPLFPRCLRIRRQRWIPFQDRDLMSIASQHQRCTQPDDPSTDNDDSSHTDGLAHRGGEREDGPSAGVCDIRQDGTSNTLRALLGALCAVLFSREIGAFADSSCDLVVRRGVPLWRPYGVSTALTKTAT